MASDCPARARRLGPACLLALLVASTPALGLAQTAADKETARTLMDEGDQKSAARDLDGALKAYAAAHRIMNVPSTGAATARTHAARGEWLEARDLCLDLQRSPVKASEPAAFTKARAECEALAAKAAEKIVSLRFKIQGLAPNQEPAILLDGAPVPAGASGALRRTNPGKRVVLAKLAGYEDVRVELVVGDQREVEVPLVFKRVSEATPTPGPASATAAGRDQPAARDKADEGGSSTSKLVWIGFGVAGVGVAVGGITGLLAFQRTSDAKGSCAGRACPESSRSDFESARTMGNVSTVAFAVGLVGAGVGVYGLFSDKKSTTASVAPAFGLGTLGAVGRF